jgi:hypothetical protein
MSFEENRQDVERLMKIHEDLTGGTPGRKRGVEVLNKSAIVLMCAVWEAYCEDLAAEAVEHLVKHANGPTQLPKGLLKLIATELKADKNELAVWGLAGTGWRKTLRVRLASITARRNRTLNTPKANNIDLLFTEAVGLPDVSKSWRWHTVSVSKARAKLDEYVELRGSIAHRAKAADAIKKSHVSGFIAHAERLVNATDDWVNAQLAAACGTPLF